MYVSNRYCGCCSIIYIIINHKVILFRERERDHSTWQNGDLLSSEELHPQQGKDEYEQEEQEEEGDDGAHTVEQWDDQVPQGGPVPAVASQKMMFGILLV